VKEERRRKIKYYINVFASPTPLQNQVKKEKYE
jgi:hypothetical protein